MRFVQIGLWTALFAIMGMGSGLSQHGNEETKAALAAVQPAEGLKVDLFAADPLLFNPVAFSIDEQGRFFIAESHRWKDSVFDLWTKDERWKLADFSFTEVAHREKFLREEFSTNLTHLTKDSEVIRLVEDRDGDGVAETSEVFADGFNGVTSGTAAGVLASEGKLWFTCIPDLWRFEYDQEGQMTKREVLHTGYGVRISVSGHDLHGLVQGPDGRIYFSVGDRGANVRSMEGRQLESVNGGAVFRCEPDGTNLELFAIGLRNPQDLAFDDLGNLWTHDNDTSGEDPPRVLHVVEGGEYGWRQAYQFMPEFGPWVLEKVGAGELDDVLPSAGVGAQGPAGMAAYPGVGLSDQYRGALLACDFPQGVWAYHFEPDGATYKLRKEKFLWALGPTDVDFGPDGAVYISDWGRSYSMPNGGRLLRVTGANDPEPGQEVKRLIGGGIARSDSAALAEHLGHADRRVRLAAQFELERRKAMSVLMEVATASSKQLDRLHAIWGLGNLGRKGLAEAGVEIRKLATDADPEIRAQAAGQLGELPPNHQIVTALTGLLRDDSPRVQMQAALALGRLGAKDQQTTQGLLALAEKSAAEHPFVRHAVVRALERSRNTTGMETAARHSNPIVRRVALLAWRRLQSAEVARFLTDPDPMVRRDAARAINDTPIPEAFERLANLLNASENDGQVLLRAINANFRLGGTTEWERVRQFAAESQAAENLRVAAVAALADWGSPGPLDRVVGIWRPVSGNRSAGSSDELAATFRGMLKHSAVPLVQATLDAIEKLGLHELGPDLLAQVVDAAQPVAVRVRALQALGAMKAEPLADGVDAALADKEPTLRAAGMQGLGSVEPSRALATIREVVGSKGDLRIRQSAMAATAKLQDPGVDRFLTGQLELLRAGKLDPALELDLMEAVKARGPSKLTKQLEDDRVQWTDGRSLGSFSWAMAGGNAAAGKKAFHERDALGCLRCHAVSGRGGTVGPDLAGIGSKRDRKHLLESIVHPNAQITTGYESVAVILKDGRSFAGSVQSDNGTEVVINSAEDGLVTIRHDEIERRQRSLSAMPEGLVDLMERRELRDLVEYLATLK